MNEGRAKDERTTIEQTRIDFCAVWAVCARAHGRVGNDLLLIINKLYIFTFICADGISAQTAQKLVLLRFILLWKNNIPKLA